MLSTETEEELALPLKIVEVKLLRFQEFCNRSCDHVLIKSWVKGPPRASFGWGQLLLTLRSSSLQISKLTSCSLKDLSSHPSKSFRNIFKMRFITSSCLLRLVGMIEPSVDLNVIVYLIRLGLQRNKSRRQLYSKYDSNE